jgi:ubiquinone/menaquinone biosynthesis C-methylase UbiE
VAVQGHGLRPGLTVLDIGCGTGLNFELILDAIGTQGSITGIDTSTKMLNRARQKVNHNKWMNVRLLQNSLLTIKGLTGRSVKMDSIICTLGFSVFPDWQAVFERSFALLESGSHRIWPE